MTLTEHRAPRTYGNWRKPQTAGLGQLGMIGTGILLAGLIGVIVAMMFGGLMAAGAVAAALVVVLAVLVVRDRHGRNGLQRMGEAAGGRLARARGAHLYRSGPLGNTPWGTYQLPGLAAASQLSEWEDSQRRKFALIFVPQTKHYTVVLAADPDGASLVDPEQIDSWVAHWGGWLNALGSEPGLVAATVTIETAPDTGGRLRREVALNADPNAPEVAQAMLREVIDCYPSGSATVRAWVALTFTDTSPSARRRRDAAEMGRDLAARLPGLTRGLSATGAGAARPVSAQELCEMVRTAYDPDAGRLLDAARATGEVAELEWDNVGPSFAQANRDHYLHDGAVSVTWSMTSAPRGVVQSTVLSRLLAPNAELDRKRVTLLYRPFDPARSARIAEQDKRNADFKVVSSKRPSARAIAAARSAAATAEEEARGSNLVNFGLLVTVTVRDQDRLPEAVAAVDNLSGTARLMLRPVFGSQDSAFAAALPLGLVLPSHLKVPAEIRESL
ncbi:hypothetical protein CLV92_11920 [Kineococcus xinjiangensis]|uniref:Integral membrane protein n=1 Tax=Kineococcus xinjiangensis TaxID=512762 RepID=A0A2S6ICL0_9ACTN|nr:SCO6880 family protein [Kineococcus xinjiangensis]PPK91939.1 hypothetical protein CLV92_11920 [Kineococcus xinjiangensis]